MDGALTITKAPLTVTGDAASRAYGAANPTFTATLSGFVNGEVLATSGVSGLAACTSAATPTSPVSPPTVAITCTVGTLAATNYDFTPFVDGALTITEGAVDGDRRRREPGVWRCESELHGDAERVREWRSAGDEWGVGFGGVHERGDPDESGESADRGDHLHGGDVGGDQL